MIGELSEEEAAANLLNEENEPAEFQDNEGGRGGGGRLRLLIWVGMGAERIGQV